MATADGQKLNPILRGTTKPASWKRSSIDRSKAIRTVPMRVLSMSYPRTGTMSTAAALYVLGMDDVYHMTSAYENPKDFDLWERAINAKMGKGKFTKRDWDGLLGHCQATTDWPCSAFPDELIAAYPEAKVILNVRPTDKWYASAESTFLSIGEAMGAPVVIRPLVEVFGWILKSYGPDISKLNWMSTSLQRMVNNGDTSKEAMRAAYEKHNAHVKAIVPPQNLLIWGPQDGWEPLCKFLNLPIPELPVPYINETESFQQHTMDIGTSDLIYLAKRAAVYTGVMAGMVGFGRYIGLDSVLRGWYRGLGITKSYLPVAL